MARMARRLVQIAVLISCLPMVSDPAAAHHVMGRIPVTFYEGMLSGLGHPIIGFDHLVAIIAVGSLAALTRYGVWLAVGYSLTVVGGAACLLQGAVVPYAEVLVAVSILILGIMLLSRAVVAPTAMGLMFLVTGLIHGYALGESIIGAEAAPLSAYLIGLAIVQAAIALAALYFVRAMINRKTADELRVLGGIVLGIAITLLIQHVTALAA